MYFVIECEGRDDEGLLLDEPIGDLLVRGENDFFFVVSRQNGVFLAFIRLLNFELVGDGILSAADINDLMLGTSIIFSPIIIPIRSMLLYSFHSIASLRLILV